MLKAQNILIGILLLSLLLTIGLFVSACTADETTEPDLPPLEAQVSQSASSETATPISTADIPGSIDEPAMDECLDCHTDKDRLIQTASPVEEVESENSGEG